MRLFDDPLFGMFGDRVLGLVSRGGAEYGECAATAARVKAGDADSWHDAWFATAARVESEGEDSAARGHVRSAADAFWRATTYFRASYQPLFGAPVDPRLPVAFARESACFARMATLVRPPVVPVEVPFEDTTLSGYLCLPDDGRTTGCPCLIGVNGYDSNVHEMYWSHAFPAIRRGYVCLLVDGPGQGRALVEQGLTLRPDWDTVLSGVVGFALARPEVDPERVAVMGWSLGGYLAPRGVAGDGRVQALIADPGQWDLLAPMLRALPDDLAARAYDAAPAELEPYFTPLLEDPVLHWKLAQRGLWVHGVAGMGELAVELGRFRLADHVAGITCSTLVVANETDAVSAQAETLYAELPGPKTLLRLKPGHGYTGHCQTGNRSGFDRLAFDWLDEVLRP